MPRHTEPSANNALGNLLQGMLGKATVRSENTQIIKGHPGLRPDIVITALGRSPVVVESEYIPAATVELDARSRLGLQLSSGGDIEAAIALRFPEGVGDSDNLSVSIGDATLDYCVFTVESEDTVRFPESGWLSGSVADLADFVRLVSVPQKAVDEAATHLEQGIEDAANILETMHKTRPGITEEIAKLLGLHNVPQTRRMASAIIANALIFHGRIAGMKPAVKPIHLVCGDDISDPQGHVLAAWKEILDINYYPIFAIGRDIVSQLPASEATIILSKLRDTAAKVESTGVNNAHDLTGRMFQKLISDRKYLATFYTLPASASLLARLAVGKMEGINWSDPKVIGHLKVGDFACGTGALLSAVYEQIAARHESVGGDAEKIHPVMMEEVLYGCDVMPSAVHITGSTLAGIQPGVDYGKSRLYTMPYGRQEPDKSVKIGSLELLQSSEVLTLFNTSDPALRTGSTGEETAAQLNVEIADNAFDLVIMNPPFTRAGSDWEGSNRPEDYVKQFRGLANDLETQKEMSKRLKKFSDKTCFHGYAGIGSAFAALGNKKLKPGGILALVLPLAVAAGSSWEKLRELLRENYVETSILSIASESAKDNDLSFSSDTGMAECLVVARKRLEPKSESSNLGLTFSSLHRRPPGFAGASSVAKEIDGSKELRSVADGPYGGSGLQIGAESAGAMLIAPLTDSEGNWGCVRIQDFSVAQTAYALENSNLWLPAQTNSHSLPIVPLKDIGTRGWHDINIAGSAAPFAKFPSSPTATFPCLWGHNAKKETRLIRDVDIQLQVKQGMESKAAQVWATASRTHTSRGFRFTSQPLSVAFTEYPSVGGRAWPNVSFDDGRFEYAFSIWGNCTLGLLSYWWHSSRQQSGRGEMSVTSIETLAVLDLRTLSDEQLATAERIFDEFRELDLMPAYLADADPNRALLDRRVVCDLLGFDEEIYKGVRRLAQKWCAEPSVHGGKAPAQRCEIRGISLCLCRHPMRTGA